MGWSGFNGGYPFAANVVSSIAILNTHVCAATSLLVWTWWDFFFFKKPSAIGAIQGIMTGLVCITPAAGYICVYMCVCCVCQSSCSLTLFTNSTSLGFNISSFFVCHFPHRSCTSMGCNGDRHSFRDNPLVHHDVSEQEIATIEES